MYSFKNDYNTIAAPKIIEALVKFQSEQNVGYGEDYHTQKVNQIVSDLTKKNVDTYILTGGTQTNLVGLAKMLGLAYQAVIAVDSGHINVHETGAIEGTGHKVITIPGDNGKANPSKVEEEFTKYSDHHMVKPKALYISNSTEIGTTYTKSELIALSNVCKKLDMYLFMDGARLGVALASKENDLSLQDIATYTDMFYIGGTKLGLPIGECLVIVNDELKKDMKYLIKNRGALLAKGFFAGICFEAFFKDNYYLDLASHANRMADLFRAGLKDNIVYANNTNQVFVKCTIDQLEILGKDYSFEIWENNKNYLVIRLVTTFQTNEEYVNKFIKEYNSIKK